MKGHGLPRGVNRASPRPVPGAPGRASQRTKQQSTDVLQEDSHVKNDQRSQRDPQVRTRFLAILELPEFFERFDHPDCPDQPSESPN